MPHTQSVVGITPQQQAMNFKEEHSETMHSSTEGVESVSSSASSRDKKHGRGQGGGGGRPHLSRSENIKKS